MIDLYFDVDCQKLSRTGEPTTVIRGTKNYLRLNFKYSSDWAGMVVVAIFGDKPVLVNNSTCMVPNELTDRPIISFKLAGKRDNVILTTNEVKIRQEV